MATVLHLIQENEYDPIEGRLEVLKKEFYDLFVFLTEQGRDEDAAEMLEAFDLIFQAAEKYQSYMYPDLYLSPEQRIALYAAESGKWEEGEIK
jgi:hypothetical protein